MKRRSFLAAGGAAGLAATIGGLAPTAPALAGLARPTAKDAKDGGATGPGSLRSLAARIGLHIGTAVIPFDLDTPDYAAILASQFSHASRRGT